MILVSKLFAATELSKTLSIPFEIHNLVLGAYDFIIEKGEGRIDAFLGILGSISEIGDATSSIAAMLVDIGALGASAMSWAGPLNLASCALSAVFIVMSIRSLYFSAQVTKKLNQVLKKPSQPNYREAYKVIKNHKYELGSHCGVDVKLVQSKVNKLYKEKHRANTKADRKVAEQKMDKAFKALKCRIHHKQFSHVLGILATKLGIIATITFAVSAFFAPLAIGGCVVLAILFSACMFKMGFDLYANSRFKRSLNAIQTA